MTENDCIQSLCEVQRNMNNCDAIFEKKLHKHFSLVLEKLCPIDRKLKLGKIKSTSAYHTVEPKFR